MYKKHPLALAVGFCLATGVMANAQAASWKAGDWELSLGGNVNAFYTLTQCDAGDLGAGGGTMAGLACLDPDTGKMSGDDTHGVSNGLLPASLNFSAKTKQKGYDISAVINVYYGLASQDSGAAGDALDFSTVDARQVYLTFGNERMGTVKAGRDFGLFAFDAIINDMTLLGTGATFASAGPGHTTLGGLGYGYVYTDRLSQMNWTAPSFNGFEATLGVFNPLDGLESNGASTGDGGEPGFHGKLSYKWDAGNGLNGLVSVSGLHQKVRLDSGHKPTMQGVDIFAQVNVQDATVAAAYYQGQGMDTLGLGGIIFPGFDSVTGEEEEVEGYMLQATYKIFDTKLGLNYSHSEQTKLNKVENDKFTVGVYHNLTESLILVGEFSKQESELIGVGKDKSNSFALGAMVFF